MDIHSTSILLDDYVQAHNRCSQRLRPMVFRGQGAFWLLAIIFASISISHARLARNHEYDTSISIRQSVPVYSPQAFTGAYWIWTSETNPPEAPAEDCAFRKTYTSIDGKTAVSASILMTVDDGFTLFVNGVSVGTALNSTFAWQSSQVFVVALSPTTNLFAVHAINNADFDTGGDSPAGLLAAIQISYSDGTSALVTSDNSWKATKSIPPDFQSLSTDDSQWGFASVQAPYGSGPWASFVILPSPGPILSLDAIDSFWIWSPGEGETLPTAPPGSLAFRNTYAVPSGKEAIAMTVIVTADDSYVLYLNGEMIGASPPGNDTWQVAERYTPNLLQNSSVAPTQFVFAINATNNPGSAGDGPAGLLVAIQIVYSDGTFDIHRSDSTWLVDKTVDPNFFQVTASNSDWSNASVIGIYRAIQPWDTVVVSTPPSTSGSESNSSDTGTSSVPSGSGTPVSSNTSSQSNTSSATSALDTTYILMALLSVYAIVLLA